MNPRFAATLLLLWVATPVFAHRLDEYLQAATFNLERDRIAIELRLTPGLAVLEKVLAAIDTSPDAAISDAERIAYGNRVLNDLSLSLDGHRLPLQLVSCTFPERQDMKQGVGEIVLNLEAP